MRRITRDVQKWDVYQGRETRGLDPQQKDDCKEKQFGDEVFGRMITGDQVDELTPEQLEDSPKEMLDWAQHFHAAADANPAFRRLTQEVKGSVPLAGIATSKMLEDLEPLMKEFEKKQAEAEAAAEKEFKKSGNRPPKMEANKLISPDVIRRAVKKAVEQAAGTVQDIKEAMDGLDQVYMPGTEKGDHKKQESDRIKRLAAELKKNGKLAKVAKLVGRFRRQAVTKWRNKVHHAQDEVNNIVCGNEIARLLPNELVRLKHKNKLARLLFFRDYCESALLQYELRSHETKVRGPMVVCIDKSGSMYGDPDAWATAVALALADVAHREKRTFALLSFDTGIIHQCIVKPGEPIPEKAVLIEANGGTDIDVAYAAALNIIEKNPGTLNEADIVMITDGASYQNNTEALREKAKEMGVTGFGIAIGVPADCLKPWVDHVTEVQDVATLDDKLTTKLFGG